MWLSDLSDNPHRWLLWVLNDGDHLGPVAIMPSFIFFHYSVVTSISLVLTLAGLIKGQTISSTFVPLCLTSDNPIPNSSSMEFHGILHGIPWNTCVIWNGALLIPWNPMELGDFFYLATPEFHGIPWNIPWKSRVTWYWIKWQSQSSTEFHGTKCYFIWRHQSSMKFHGIFHGIP